MTPNRYARLHAEGTMDSSILFAEIPRSLKQTRLMEPRAVLCADSPRIKGSLRVLRERRWILRCPPCRLFQWKSACQFIHRGSFVNFHLHSQVSRSFLRLGTIVILSLTFQRDKSIEMSVFQHPPPAKRDTHRASQYAGWEL